MSEAELPLLIKMTSKVVAAYVTKNHVQAAEIPALIATVHASLSGSGTAPGLAKLVPAVPINKSVTDEYIISLENGRRLKAMKRHLTVLGMTPAQYRAKWGLPADYPLLAPAYARQRSDLARRIGLGVLRKRG